MRTTTPPSPNASHPPHQTGGAKGQTHRTFLDRLGLAALLAAISGQATLMLRALVPNVLYEPARRFKVGQPRWNAHSGQECARPPNALRV